MSNMFYKAESFNSDLLLWNVRKVVNMRAMFHTAKSFKIDPRSRWTISQVSDINQMFDYTQAISYKVGY